MARKSKTSEDTENKKASSKPTDDANGDDASMEANSDSPETESDPVIIEVEAVEVTEETAGETIAGDASIASDPPPKRASAIPALLGGVLAGAIGFFAAMYGQDYFTSGSQTPEADGIATNAQGIADLETEIQSMRDSIPTIPAPVDLTGVEGEIAKLGQQLAEIDGGLSKLEADLEALSVSLEERSTKIEDRISAIETADRGGIDISAEAEAELSAFRSEIETLTARAAEQIESAEARAAEIQEAARKKAEEAERLAAEAEIKAARQTALIDLSAALESGARFKDAIEKFDGVPKVLVENADSGITTLGSLQQEFPKAARKALAVSQTLPEDASAGAKLTAFLKRRTNARSLTPQEGDGTDAVLSRAEARLGEGDLPAALEELAALDDAAKGAMANWLAPANVRNEALKAVDLLAAPTN